MPDCVIVIRAPHDGMLFWLRCAAEQTPSKPRRRRAMIELPNSTALLARIRRLHSPIAVWSASMSMMQLLSSPNILGPRPRLILKFIAWTTGGTSYSKVKVVRRVDILRSGMVFLMQSRDPVRACRAYRLHQMPSAPQTDTSG